MMNDQWMGLPFGACVNVRCISSRSGLSCSLHYQRYFGFLFVILCKSVLLGVLSAAMFSLPPSPSIQTTLKFRSLRWQTWEELSITYSVAENTINMFPSTELTIKNYLRFVICMDPNHHVRCQGAKRINIINRILINLFLVCRGTTRLWTGGLWASWSMKCWPVSSA